MSPILSRKSTSKSSGGACAQPTLGIDASRANAAKRTGVEWYAFRVIRELKSVVPPSVHVILYSKEPLRDGLENLPANWESRVLRWPPFAFRASGGRSPASWRFWTQIRLSWEMFRRPPDELFVPAHALPIILPKRVVTTIHDVAFMTLPRAYGRFERLYHRWATRQAVRRADCLLVPSEFSKSEIVKWFGADAAKIVVTPLGFDAEHCRPAPAAEVDDILARYRLKRPYFLFVGRLETKKNLAGLLRAFGIFAAARPAGQSLVLVGKRGLGFESEAKQAGFTSNLNPFDPTTYPLPPTTSIHELGYVCEDDMRFLYSGATALVLPSWYEGFGLPVVEAFACGTPVIASRVASLPEVGGEAALYVDPAKPEELAAAMVRLADDDAARVDLTRRGLARAQNFSYRRTAEVTWSSLKPWLASRCD